MSGVSQIIQSRQRRNKLQGKSLSRRLGQISIAILIIFSLLISVLTIGASFRYVSLLDDLPSHESLLPIFDELSEEQYSPTRLYDRTGQHLIAILENPNARGQKYLAYGEVEQNNLSLNLILATISSNEPNFWNNPGLSWESLQNENRPTIAQKIIRLFIFNDTFGSSNEAFQERILAAQIINTFGHEQILEWYLNSEYYGNLAYGADAAARIYFGKSASDLNLAEAATLVAASQSPSVNPIDAPIASNEAKTQILTTMFEQGLITGEQLDDGLNQEIKVEPASGFLVNLEPAFTNLVIDQVSQYIPEERIYRGGLNIHTTMDYELQNQIDCSVEYHLSRISGETSTNLTSSDFDDCEMARLLPSSIDKIAEQENPISADVIVLDPHVGQLMALVRGGTGNQDQVGFAGHSPGSILSPFIYLTYFTRGTSPATLLWDIPANIPPGITEIQYDIDQFHGPVNLRTALANDYLVPALQVLTQMDPDQVWQTAGRMGLTRLQVPSGIGMYSILFQGGETDLTELSQAYGVLANQGVLSGIPRDNSNAEDPNSPIRPQSVLQVLDNTGNILLDCTDQITECHPIKRPVLTQELAYLVTDVLSDETARWPSLGHPNSLEIGRPVAAKIGSTNDNDGFWTLGYTPDLVAGVWVGPEGNSPGEISSPAWSADLWHAVLQYASKKYPTDDFPIPANISELAVCDPSGMLPSKDCPQVVDEVFISGNEPTQIDNLYKTIAINSQSGRLATIYTPPALVEEQVFLVFPPEAEEWAINAGLPQIPDDYDVLDIELVQDSDARISSPPMFSTVKGSVQIMGRAAGNGFKSYRLQVGSGLNPDAWFQIGEEVKTPVQNGKLGIWDTSQLSGLHVLQLLVSYEDESVASSMVQVTIDNQEPAIDIHFPQNEMSIKQQDTEMITILAQVSDNLGVDRVEFFVDGDLFASLNSPPYVVPWRTITGKHVIRVSAYDHAGNMNDSRVQIVIE
jgi:membrane carboxypeptidase/penicillin-binding protein